MAYSDAHLVSHLLDADAVQSAPTRDGYGKGLVEAGRADDRVVVLSADLTESTKSHWFAAEFPERFFELGVAEQNMATVAAGLASAGKIPFISSYATFSPGRNWEQIRTTICINNLPVKVAGCHAGVSVGPDGATHQALEDIALMRVLPRMVVVVPCDAVEAYKATVALARNGKPSYLRLTRDKTPVITTPETPFVVGRAQVFREGSDVAIIACGPLVYQAMLAAEGLARQGIESVVINSHTIKPLDTATILTAARLTGAVVTVEEHQAHGGLGSAVSELLALHLPTPQEFVAVHDRFGQSGIPAELLTEYSLDEPAIQAAVHKVLSRKKISA